MKFCDYEEVITLVEKGGVPKGSLGVIVLSGITDGLEYYMVEFPSDVYPNHPMPTYEAKELVKKAEYHEGDKGL
ncbi:MAG: hypothetical protein WC196_03830 [Bacilli bacterium]|jgi:hypothetical protein|nr:hypothetical protein [Bacilli bacterium]MDD3422100.1 hypothetical protein [Bacilli bacterium]